MAKTVRPEDLGKAVEQELTIYHRNIVDGMVMAGEKAVKALVKKTKATAPKDRGDFKRSIACKLLEKTYRGSTHVWYVKAPNYRLTHLLVKGHATRGGGEPVKGNPFLANALAEVMPEYENDVKEVLQNGE